MKFICLAEIGHAFIRIFTSDPKSTANNGPVISSTDARHYQSTEQIFLEIVHFLLGNQQNEFNEKMKKSISAKIILHDILTKYEAEMIDRTGSLSIAIYEFFSNPHISKSKNSIVQQYLTSKEMCRRMMGQIKYLLLSETGGEK